MTSTFLFDNSPPDISKEILIPAGEELVYLGLFVTGNRARVHFRLQESAKLDARFLVIAGGGTAEIDISTTIESSYTCAQIEYRAFAFEDANISVNTHIDIRAGLENASGNISGKNIFFADHAKISGIPRISAASDRIQAGHTLSSEKLSKIDEFFLQSRWISEEKAKRMLAEAHIHRIFSGHPIECEGAMKYFEEMVRKR